MTNGNLGRKGFVLLTLQFGSPPVREGNGGTHDRILEVRSGTEGGKKEEELE